MWSDELKEVRSFYGVDAGYLGVPSVLNDDHGRSYPGGYITWYSCREDFHRSSVGLRFFHFAYCHASLINAAYDKIPKNVCAFIDKIEDRLDLNVRTKMGHTVLPGKAKTQVMWVQRPLWWTCENMRRSLFTALLRAGLSYDPERDNFDEAIRSRNYTAYTMPAVERFLEGYTSYKGTVTGWQSAFDGYNKDAVQSLLVAPARKRRNVERI